ncbi:MAG: C-terminal binding protein [Planctomicrobium sp.]|jgi:D-3-phosphoglycerate dehydrogenase / 2-oxoglutarate reductase|nr:C-terminal binding protein [Planctomicrobium sp.]
MSKYRVLLTDRPWADLEIEKKILSPIGVELIDSPDGSESSLQELAANVDAIATCWAEVTEKVVRSAKNCKVICRMGIGLDNIDIETASELKIPVTNVPDYCVEEVADHTMGLLLALKRNIGFFHQRTKQGEYNLKAGPPMQRLKGMRLGLIGFGRIGREVYQRARAFGLDVVASTPSGNQYGTDCPMLPLKELLQTSKIISLHAPLTDETQHLLDATAFEQMPAGVCIINTSRGPLIDPVALEQAIQAGKVAGAGLDVFDPEPPDLNDSLYQNEKVIVTPHAAFVSEEALTDLRTRVAMQIKTVLEGGVPENVVNEY